MMSAVTRLLPLMAALVLAGCASVAPDGLRGAVGEYTQSRLPAGTALADPAPEARAQAQQRIHTWLTQPVDADTAVRIALLNSPALEAQIAALGVQDAQRVQALTLPNPTLTLGRFVNGHEREIERQLSFGLVSLLTLPWRTRWQGWQMEQATLTAAQQVLLHAADTRRAWVRAVAAQQSLAAAERMYEAAAAGGELARRMARVGNFSKLEQAQPLRVQHEAAAQLARARLNAALERAQLARLMGLWGPQADFALPTALPPLPQADALRRGDDAEATALRERLDLRALRRDLDSTAERNGFARVRAVFGDIGASYSRNTATDRATRHDDVTRGWELDIPLPLLDWGNAASGAARANLQRSAAQLRDTALRARSEARTGWLRYRTAWDLAHQQQAEVLPLAQFMQDEAVYRYNGMFISTWQLLDQARATAQAVATATDAQRDFWLAEVDLQLALTGTSPGASAATANPAAAASAAPPMKATDMQRRTFFTGAATAVAAASVGRTALAALPEPVLQASADTAPPLTPPNGRPYHPVVTLNGWTTPWRMNAGVKEFHLVAEPVVREVAPGFFVNMWGYNGQSPGPTIEVVEGDQVRIFVTNRLPENTTIHWHGQRLPNGMDGVGGLNQPHIPPGKTFVYEFVARRPGTFMYHPHSDEMVQMAMGMMGLWITHPKARHPLIADVQRDYAFLLSAFAVEPGALTPRVNEMTDFNIWTFNSRAFPAITPLVARQGDRVRIRVGNLTMTNHPIHIHGHEFEVTGTDGGPVPRTARWPEVTTDVAVGQMRQVELIADEPGDWAFHCHKSHHTMGAMGHGVPTMIGVDHSGLVGKIQKIVPDYMLMGERGMGDMGTMQMPLPDNTFPMMTGTGPFGPIEMGGMFTTFKVRKQLGANDYTDPGGYPQPKGTVAYEWQGAPLAASAPRQTAPGQTPGAPKVRKPDGSAHKHD